MPTGTITTWQRYSLYPANVKYLSGVNRLTSDAGLALEPVFLCSVAGDVAAGVASPVWIQFFDSATVPGNGAVADFAIGPLFGAAFFSAGDIQRPMLTGLSWCVSSTNPTKTLAGAVAVVYASWRG